MKSQKAEQKRIEALIVAEGSGAATRWMSLATAAMGGNAAARDEVARLIGCPVTALSQLWMVQGAALNVMTPAERTLDYRHTLQVLQAGAVAANKEANSFLANRLGAMRRENGLTQTELAQKAGVTLVTLQKLENGTNSLLGARVETVANIARALGKTVEDIIG